MSIITRYDKKYDKIKHLADESPFLGERQAALSALSKVKDKRLSNQQMSIVSELSRAGFDVMYEVP
jgi:hypothetical protein